MVSPAKIDMKQIFLAPRSDETAHDNFQSTIESGVDKNRVIPFLNSEEINMLGDTNILFIWGAQPRVENKWNKMKRGDFILFYQHYNFTIAAEVLLTKYNEDLALELWPASKDTGNPWACLYFVTNLRVIDLPIKKFNKIANYQMKYLRGFQRVSGEHLQKIESLYGSSDNFIEAITKGLKTYEIAELNSIASSQTEEVSGEQLAKLDAIVSIRNIDEVLAEHTARNMDKSPEEKLVMQKRIMRDYKLVKAIKEKFQNKCQFCGFTFVTGKGTFYSEAAHIKPISTREAGVDTAENILILCANHHRMLDTQAIIQVSKSEYKYGNEIIKILDINEEQN